MKLRKVDGWVVLAVISILLVLLTLPVHAQVGGSIAPPINGPSYQPYSNPRHADQTPMAAEHSLLYSGSITVAQGERPLWEFGNDVPETPLGTVARAYREEHAKLAPEDRAKIVWRP
jgi:hypothetical protein